MLFGLAKNSTLLQDIVVSIVTSIHPSIEHNLSKIAMLKKAFFHCELEQIPGSYFEFGIYEGTSMLAALKINEKYTTDLERRFYGFDSFDEGFKYFNKEDEHPFFKEGDFTSAYEKVKKRLSRYKNATLVKGYFENTVADKKPGDVCPGETCAVAFIDCDLMGPARIALEFLAPILEVGSVIILDDYWAYKGSQEKGTCGALSSFLSKHKGINLREYCPYGYGGQSFMVTRNEERSDG